MRTRANSLMTNAGYTFLVRLGILFPTIATPLRFVTCGSQGKLIKWRTCNSQQSFNSSWQLSYAVGSDFNK